MAPEHEPLELTTTQRRKLYQTYRNAILHAVNKRLFGIVAAWFPKLNRSALGERLGMDAANLNKWENDGELSLRMLLEILMRCEKDFADLAEKPGDRFLTPSRASSLKLAALRAVLNEFASQLQLNDEPRLTDDREVVILIHIVQAGKLDCANWDWVFKPSARNPVDVSGSYIRQCLRELGITTESAQRVHLDRLRSEWHEVAMAVFDLFFPMPIR